MRIPGLKGLRLAARWLRSRFVGEGLILGYHRVADVARDTYSLCVTPQHFAEQLQVLHQYTQPISLRQLVKGLLDGNLPQRAVVVTFDDGYADVAYHAMPLLERYQIPATVFVTTGYIGREFWWDELERIVLSAAVLPDELFLDVKDGTFEWTVHDAAYLTLDKGAPSPRQRLLQSLYALLLPLSYEERQGALARLWAWAGTRSNDRAHPRALTSEELVQLTGGSLVDIGAHTVTHPVLSSLPAAAQRSEIEQSKACLEELLGHPVTSFSYANGSSSEETPALVRDAGFVCACASHNDVAWRGSDHFYLPRFWIPDWDGQVFSRWLQRWLRS